MLRCCLQFKRMFSFSSGGGSSSSSSSSASSSSSSSSLNRNQESEEERKRRIAQQMGNKRFSNTKILVNPRNKANPVMTCIHKSCEYAQVGPDFVISDGVCACFMDIRVYAQNKGILESRDLEVRSVDFPTRILLILYPAVRKRG
eukprot:TRINITY_DN1344_c0_g2_i1.p1 TRINITY_DN1344_c0_g2~~TRINITY_DN1344_c0_g2_i1.p1  ORF type:complete len:145 (-),score=45.84 TRINITY_DN1344_c0_g2_i1:31-465(-)